MAVEAQPCYRHPKEETRIRCTRCDRPICPACMHPAPVGHHCPGCVGEGRRAVRRPLAPIRRLRRLSLTNLLLIVLAAVFVVELARGATRDIGALVSLGAMSPLHVAGGQYWRLVTATFLHADVWHIALNVWALTIFGPLVEDALGAARLAAIYLVTGFVASATSYAFGDVVTVAVGASGAIFGLVGAWVAYNLRRHQLSMARANLQWALILVGINVVFGLTVPGIDNLAHLGGLAAGFLAGGAAEGVGRRGVRVATQVVGLVLVAAIGVALVAWRTSQLADIPFVLPVT
jgi:membrane associated rhomboid family serine protease